MPYSTIAALHKEEVSEGKACPTSTESQWTVTGAGEFCTERYTKEVEWVGEGGMRDESVPGRWDWWRRPPPYQGSSWAWRAYMIDSYAGWVCTPSKGTQLREKMSYPKKISSLLLTCTASLGAVQLS